MTEIRITVTNTSDAGGTALTPFWFGLHDSSFDLFNVGGPASEGLERIAEDGSFGAVADELTMADADGQGGVVAGARGPIVPGETTSSIITVNNAGATPYLSLAAMVLPSNDAFVGTDDAVRLFDDNGNFLGAQTVTFEGDDVYDAGTEENTELDAAFINQTAPNTGIDENGLITQHPGFIGSVGNTEQAGETPIILGGTNAFGDEIDPVAADFTREGALIAEVHINTVNRETGGNRSDFLLGGRDDDIFEGGGGADLLIGRSGYDVLSGGNGRDKLFGGSGNDELYGGNGRDFLSGGSGNDSLSGGNGRDILKAGSGDDLVAGGTGRDQIWLGSGADTLVFNEGDGRDVVYGFDANDTLALNIEGIDSAEDLAEAATSVGGSTLISFGGGDSILLVGTSIDELTNGDLIFA